MAITRLFVFSEASSFLCTRYFHTTARLISQDSHSTSSSIQNKTSGIVKKSFQANTSTSEIKSINDFPTAADYYQTVPEEKIHFGWYVPNENEPGFELFIELAQKSADIFNKHQEKLKKDYTNNRK